MESDRIRWNEKHAAKTGSGDPDVFFLKHFHRLVPGNSLDLASGRGRHAIYLANHGHQVIAVDISGVAIEKTEERALASKLEIKTLQADLDQHASLFAPESFQNIVCINFRPSDVLLSQIPTWLTPHGCFLWCSFNELQAEVTGFPAELAMHHKAFVHFPGLQTLVYERFEDHTGLRDGYLFLKK